MEKGEISKDPSSTLVQNVHRIKARHTKRKRKQKHRSPIVSTPMHKVFCQAFFQKSRVSPVFSLVTPADIP